MSEKERSMDHDYLTIPADQVVEDDILVNWGNARVCGSTSGRRVNLYLKGGTSIHFAAKHEVIVKRPKPEFVTVPASSVQVGDEVLGKGEVLEVITSVLLMCKGEDGFTWYQTPDPLLVRRK